MRIQRRNSLPVSIAHSATESHRKSLFKEHHLLPQHFTAHKNKLIFYTHHMCKLYQQWLNKNSSKSCCNRLPVQNFKERVHMYGSEVQTFDNGSEVKQQQQQVIQARSAGCIVAAECLQCFFQEKKRVLAVRKAMQARLDEEQASYSARLLTLLR